MARGSSSSFSTVMSSPRRASATSVRAALERLSLATGAVVTSSQAEAPHVAAAGSLGLLLPLEEWLEIGGLWWNCPDHVDLAEGLMDLPASAPSWERDEGDSWMQLERCAVGARDCRLAPENVHVLAESDVLAEECSWCDFPHAAFDEFVAIEREIRCLRVAGADLERLARA
jgi:hypothetical protein